MVARARTHRYRWLREDRQPLGGRVDRERGVIRDVKVLGLESANGRRYLPEALRAAVRLYEGRAVRLNHPVKPTASRDVQDTFGWLENVRADERGELWADLRVLNPKTEFAESVFRAAESDSEHARRLFGLSHNAQGDVDGPPGREVVREITEVRSVDLVCDPATTNGLFEDKRPMKLKAFLESLKLSKAAKKAVKRLLEAGMMDGEMDAPMDAPPPDDAPAGDHASALADGFKASILALVDEALAGDGEALKRITELIKSHMKLSGEGGGPSEPAEAPIEEEEEDLEESRRLKSENLAYRLCGEQDVRADAPLLEALVALGSEAKMKALLDREKGRAAPPKAGGKPPRSGSGGGKKPVVEQRGEDGAEVSDFMESLRS